MKFVIEYCGVSACYRFVFLPLETIQKLAADGYTVVYTRPDFEAAHEGTLRLKSAHVLFVLSSINDLAGIFNIFPYGLDGSEVANKALDLRTTRHDDWAKYIESHCMPLVNLRDLDSADKIHELTNRLLTIPPKDDRGFYVYDEESNIAVRLYQVKCFYGYGLQACLERWSNTFYYFRAMGRLPKQYNPNASN